VEGFKLLGLEVEGRGVEELLFGELLEEGLYLYGDRLI
jgi:hypothetical protein